MKLVMLANVALAKRKLARVRLKNSVFLFFFEGGEPAWRPKSDHELRKIAFFMVFAERPAAPRKAAMSILHAFSMALVFCCVYYVFFVMCDFFVL